MTVSMLNQARRTIGDYSGAWSGSDAEMQALIDRGTRDLARRALVIQQRTTLSTASGEPFLTLPSDLIDIFTIFYGGVALQEVEPEAVQRLDPRTTTGPPARYAMLVDILLLHPTPDAVYSLDLLYFSDDVTALPVACQPQPALFAAGLALERWHRLYESNRYLTQPRLPSRQLLYMFDVEVALLEAALSPESRDSLDQYSMQVHR